jgi:hypothetical protein
MWYWIDKCVRLASDKQLSEKNDDILVVWMDIVIKSVIYVKHLKSIHSYQRKINLERIFTCRSRKIDSIQVNVFWCLTVHN